MRKETKLEIVFGLCALGMIYFIITSNASITGFVVNPGSFISLKAPTDNTRTELTSIYFMFSYSPELEMKECSLIINGELVKTTNSLLSPYDTRIRLDLKPGSYTWRIECIEISDMIISSDSRRITIGEQEEGELRVTGFPGREGTLYEFNLREGLELEIKDTVPNDVIRAIRGENTYDVNILLVSQDYTRGIEFAELLVTPGDKRVRLDRTESSAIDFNNDGQKDLVITLKDVVFRKATFIVTTNLAEQNLIGGAMLEEPTISISPLENEAEALGETEKKPTLTRGDVQEIGALQIFLGVLIVIIVLVIIGFIRSKRKEAEEAYVASLSKSKKSSSAKKKAKKAKPAKSKKTSKRKKK
ncbi:MAG TPA: hypothetical protein VJ461_01535 [Candidatus Nanoarchaeia archaeon]|nr:hypothetical protein [Candidatus Nanoarchaeia archaeon]